MKPVIVDDARDLPEAWMNLLRAIFTQGREYEVIEGSRAGERRKTIDGLGYIVHPDHRPLAPMPRAGLATPTSIDGIQEYFNDYLVREDGPPGSKAHYVYGKWIAPMIEWSAKYLANWGPGQAHCCIRVGDACDAKQYDTDYKVQCPWCIEAKPNPECMLCRGTGFMKDETKRITTPCLVNMSLQIVPHTDGNFYLKHHITYRSWDAFNGWPENMGGFQLVKETIYDLMHQFEPFEWLPKNAKFLNGPATWRCWDVHVYSADYDAAKAWIGM